MKKSKQDSPVGERSNKKISKKKYNYKWVFIITLWTFVLAIIVSIITESVMRSFNMLLAFITLISIVLLGVVFDIIGIAVAASNEKSFHSMAANNIKEAKYSIRIVRNAGPVSNFCNDVIGDISGIISGAAGTIIVYKLITTYGFNNDAILSVIATAFIASLTVGGKAFGKEIAINSSEKIVFYVGKVLMFLDTKFNIDLLPDIRTSSKKRKKR